MAFAPLILMGVAAAAQMTQARQTANYNAAVLNNEATVARGEGVQQEDIVRRGSREAIGRETGAFGASGAGYGGSSRVALDTSSVNQEIDALNTRYKGNLTAYGYNTEANIKGIEATDNQEQTGLTTAGRALSGLQSGGYLGAAGALG